MPRSRRDQYRIPRPHLTRRAIDFHEGDKVDAKAFKSLIRAAVSLNTAKAKS